MMGFFERQVLNINPINLLDEINLTDQELYKGEDIDWNMFEPVPEIVRNGIYCDLLRSKVRMCNFVSCTYYNKCHNKV